MRGIHGSAVAEGRFLEDIKKIIFEGMEI